MASEVGSRNSASTVGRLLKRYPQLARLGRQRRRVPVIRQLSATECGAASLAMVLGGFGKHVRLDVVREACGPARDGVTASAILDAARNLNLRGRGVRLRLDQLHLVESGTAILHWKFSHFVVFLRATKKWVEIIDPACGLRRLETSQFSKDFTGIALIFEPSDLFSQQKREGIVYRTARDLLLGTGLLPKIIVMSLVLQIFGLALPVLTGQLIDRVIPQSDLDLLSVLLLGLGVVVVCRGVATVIRGILLLRLRTILDLKLTLGFLDHLASLPYSFFQIRSAGDLMMRLNSNSVVREALTSTTLSALLDGSLVIAYLAILSLGSLPMAGAAVVAMVLEIAVYLFQRGRRRALRERELDAEVRSHSYQVELLTAMETLKVTGNEHRAVSRYSNLFVDETNARIDVDVAALKIDACLSVLKAVGPLGILVAGGLQVVNGDLSLGTMLTLDALAIGLLAPVSNLIATALSLEQVGTYLERVNDVLQAKPEQDEAGVQPAPPLSGEIHLDHVSFRYGKHGRDVINDISLRITPGQFVAVVGSSGSGKTTLVNLIVGLYRPTEGRIFFDDYDLTKLEVRSVRRQIGIVNQRISLFAGTIRENISLSDPTLKLEDVVAAAKAACVHDEILQMPMQYSTPLNEGGTSVSGGQKQRLALARALVRKPPILLLDEATSALDAVTESKVQACLDALKCTRIVIAHRLSTVRKADLILVVEGGRIVEFGDHRTLLRQGGAYKKLLGVQLTADSNEELGIPRGLAQWPVRPHSASLSVVTGAGRLGAIEPAHALSESFQRRGMGKGGDEDPVTVVDMRRPDF